MTPRLSVVIPTYNRREILLKVLEAYKRQTAAGGILEILVVDDGSTDGTRQAVAQASAGSPFPIRYFCQGRMGQAAARNRGIRESLGQIILFNDDDIIPSATYAAEHLEWHEKYPGLTDAVLGKLIWSPEVNPTPFMKWLEHDVMFCFWRRRKGLLEQPLFFVGILSMKCDFLLQNGMFDEDFRAYGFEDTELCERLKRKGLRVFYNPDAVAYHHKKVSVADAWRREEQVEFARPFFMAKTGAAAEPDPFEHDGAVKKALRNSARAVLPAFSPMLKLFDTRLPLPWVVYRTFYYQYIVPRARAGAPRQ